MSKMAGSAPRREAMNSAPNKPAAINRAEKTAARYRVLVYMISARRPSPRLLQMEKRVAPPIPSMSPVPWMKL